MGHGAGVRGHSRQEKYRDGAMCKALTHPGLPGDLHKEGTGHRVSRGDWKDRTGLAQKGLPGKR